MNKVIYDKVARIEQSIHRIKEVCEDNVKNLNNLTKQGNIILNIRCAYEACVDLAMYVISERQLEVPEVSTEGFK